MQTAGTSSGRRGRFRRTGGTGQDFELNLAPIIDCLTVLITFVLLSASYLSVGVLETQVAAASSAPQSEEKPNDEMLTIELKEDHSIVMSLTGKTSRVQRINPNSDRSWNYNALNDSLALTKGEVPSLKSVVLNADSEVDYREVVKSMEIARKAVPGVMLGGY